MQSLLSPGSCSRLGGRRIVFQPYTQQQLVEIVQTRLDGLDVFEPSAIRFAAAKVGACCVSFLAVWKVGIDDVLLITCVAAGGISVRRHQEGFGAVRSGHRDCRG